MLRKIIAVLLSCLNAVDHFVPSSSQCCCAIARSPQEAHSPAAGLGMTPEESSPTKAERLADATCTADGARKLQS
eukprot:1013447-Amphidinium_carterae.1